MVALREESPRQLMLFDVFKYIDKTIPQPIPDRLRVGRFLHLGAGVQSSTLVEMMVEKEIPPVDAVLFSDTGNEPPWVYKQVWYLTKRLMTINVPLIIVRNGWNGIKADSQAERSRFVTMPLYTKDPETGKTGIMRRQCTKEYKIIPCTDWILSWLIDHEHAKRIETKKGPRRIVSRKIYVDNLYGISLDEWDRAGRRGPKWQRAVYPLIEKRMNRAACKAWLTAHNLPIPYKSSCVICPYHRNDYWAYVSINHPPIFEEACQFDDWLRTPDARRKLIRKMRQPCYLHESCIPLRQVDFTRPNQPRTLCGDHCMT